MAGLATQRPVASAIDHGLAQRGHAVLFTTTQRLERLLVSKRALELNGVQAGSELNRELRRLDNYVAVILDDIAYVQQNRDQTEVLFTFLAHRYERKSVINTSNLVFSGTPSSRT